MILISLVGEINPFIWIYYSESMYRLDESIEGEIVAS